MEDNRCAPGVVVIFNNLRLILRPTIKDRSAGISLLDHIDLGIMHTVWQQIDDSEILVLLDLRFKKVALQAESIAIRFPDGIAANSFPRRSRPPIIISVEARNFFYGQFFRAGQHIIAAFLRQIDKNRLISVLVAVNTPCLIGIADLLRPVRNMGLIRVAVDRVDLELDAFAVLHRIIVPEDDLVAIAGLILIEINRKVAAGIQILLRDGIGLRCTVCVIGYDLINDICKRLSVSQLGKCPVGFQPNKLQCLIQSLQHGLTVFRDDLTILDHNVPQRRRLLLIVVQDDSPWIGIGLIGIYIIDIPLCRPFGKPALRAGISRQTEAERIVRFGVRFTFGRIARNGGQLHAVVKVRDQLIRKCIKLKSGETQMQFVIVNLRQHIAGFCTCVGFGNRCSVGAERPSGILVRIKDRDSLHAVLVRIFGQRVRQCDLAGVAPVAQIRTHTRTAIDNKREIHIGAVVQIRISTLLQRCDNDLCAVLREFCVAVGVDKLRDLPWLILRLVDTGRRRVSSRG